MTATTIVNETKQKNDPTLNKLKQLSMEGRRNYENGDLVCKTCGTKRKLMRHYDLSVQCTSCWREETISDGTHEQVNEKIQTILTTPYDILQERHLLCVSLEMPIPEYILKESGITYQELKDILAQQDKKD